MEREGKLEGVEGKSCDGGNGLFVSVLFVRDHGDIRPRSGPKLFFVTVISRDHAGLQSILTSWFFNTVR